ncbi:MAG: hypothetical protein U1B78_00265 [Dehalococcoidia bacterium]|nr:hypothetical protein [Dehalococcoidia bacterium]
MLSFAAVENGPFLGSTGRSVACLPPLLDVGTVRYGCLTLGPEPEPPSGSGRLATLTLGTSCAGTSSLQFELASVVDVLGNHIPRTTSGGTVTVIDGPVCPPAGPPGDGDCSGLVDSVDAALALQFEAGVAGSLPCQALADLSGDAQVTALDAALVLQIVAGLL